MWTVTGLFDEQVLPEKLLTPNEGGTLRTSSLPLPLHRVCLRLCRMGFVGDKVMKCGETYTFGRNNHGNALEIHHKTVSKTVGAFCVGGWTADDIVRLLPPTSYSFPEF